MGSSRLPGKVLRSVAGRPLLAFVIERLRAARSVDSVAIATSTLPSDDAIAAWCDGAGVRCERGDEADVLARYHLAARATDADVIVRITGDCPLIDPAIVDRVVERFAAGDVDYVSNVMTRTFPRGLDTEVFARAALDAAFTEARDPAEREHVTPFIWRRPQRFRLANVAHATDLSRHRWTVDTEEDFELIRRMLEALTAQHGLAFALDDCVALIERHPDWTALNAAVEQKPLSTARSS
jgi:spore coat polysaccharide biosynthesis protein SpsF